MGRRMLRNNNALMEKGGFRHASADERKRLLDNGKTSS
jgi:hypothetical protein